MPPSARRLRFEGVPSFMLDAVAAEQVSESATEEAADPPRGLIALAIAEAWRRASPGGVLFLTGSERLAEHLGANIHALVPDCPVMVFPGWDCPPYDPAGPSREVMGRRMSVLRRLAEPASGPLVIATAEAALQRLPPRDIWPAASLTLRTAEHLDLETVREFLARGGYALDTLVDEPGEAALHGQTVDIFPAGALGPVRIDLAEDRIAAISNYDPASQRTTGEIAEIVLDPASEAPIEPTAEAGPSEEAEAARWLSLVYPRLDTLFDYMPQAALLTDRGAEDRAALAFDQIREAYDSWKSLPSTVAAEEGPLLAPEPGRLFIEQREWRSCLRRAEPLAAASGDEHLVPVFATEANPTRAFRGFVAAQLARGWRLVLAAATERELKAMARRAEPAAQGPAERIGDWQSALAAAPASLLLLHADFEAGFLVRSDEIAVVAAADLLGSRAGHETPMAVARDPDLGAPEPLFRIGDAVVHLDHGIGLLRGIETVATPDGAKQETIRLEYAGDTNLMAPIGEIGSIWRYGGAAEAVSLDRLGSEAWSKRRAEVEQAIAVTARSLVALVKEREAREAPKLAPPARDYERFAAGFRFVATADQARAIEDVLRDLKSGHPMDRLVCGDVGFGKTEIALRAAAAAALSGKQVAVVAPTTVLARQHLGLFRRRFAPFGIAVAPLSRLVRPAEARAVKKGLADGSIRVVIGTHAIAGKEVRFKELGLVVIDEEQHFGAQTKRKLRNFAAAVHVLTLTATPIPRTLQRAMVGLQELSVLRTPPARRVPIRTVLAPFSPQIVSEALLHERRRGGQSFVVCPRIEDIAPMQQRLREFLPRLRLKVVHGKMPAAEVDETMVAFADGEGDVLLATNIIESGLDIPRANTILIWRPDRFGAAQLHQLRGRVGRGRRRGLAYLLTDPEAKLAPATEKRLRLLGELDRLGAGFAISRRDMDLRGAGDLLGEEQAGHLRLIGVELYRDLLERALAAARGQLPQPDWMPQLNLEVAGLIPADYVADPEIRIDLYARLARCRNLSEIDDFAEEIADRFGAPPPETRDLLDLARAGASARALGVTRADAGPRAIALTFDESQLARVQAPKCPVDCEWNGDRLICHGPTASEGRIETVMALLDELGAA